MARSLRCAAFALLTVAAASSASEARADEPEQPAAPGTAAAAAEAAPPETPPATDSPQTVPADVEIHHPESPQRRTDLEPHPAEPPPQSTTFDVDPVADGAVIAVSLGFAGMLDLINSTGEIRPQQISPNFQSSQLLTIDRGAISQTVDPNARTFSNIGLATAAAFAVLDPVLSGVREKHVQSGIVDAFLYAESFALTFGLTNMAKLAVRRPRPQAYIDAARNRDDPNYSNADTDSALSFFSGHSSITAALGATATYLAFARSPRTARPWITMVLAAGLTTFVSIERVRAGAHFPTDVIAAAIAGAGVGIVVPHLHRSEDIKQRRVWVGFAPAPRGGGGTATLTGIF